jgi:general nucleoside transport system permease protein
MNAQIIITIFTLFFALTSVLAIAGFSGAVSEKSGIINIGIEGMMIVGALVYSIFASQIDWNPGSKGAALSQLWIFCVAGFAAMIFSLIHSVACIIWKANQVIVGTAINLLAASIAILTIKFLQLEKLVINSDWKISLDAITGGNSSHVAYMFSLPILIVIVVASFLFVMFKYTKLGTYIKASGQNPNALSAVGVNVNWIRFVAVTISGFLAGLAGAIFAQYVVGGSFRGSVNGLGFLAIAIMIFGKWKVPYILLTSSLFAILYSFADNITNISSLNAIPPDLSKVIPFILSLVALAIFSKRNAGPKALGLPYDKSRR